MINIILDQMSQTVKFKTTLSVGDLVITNYAPNNFQAQPLFGRVESISFVYEEGEVIRDLWDVTILAFFVPPAHLKLRMTTGQISGRDRWIDNGQERFFAPFEVVGSKKSAHLRLIKDDKKLEESVTSQQK